MAFEFKIYDDVDSVTFAGVGLRLAKGGYPQKGAIELLEDDWQDLSESPKFIWIEDIDQAAVQKLGRLGKRARANQDPRHPNHGVLHRQVILQVQSDNENGPRYAVLKSLGVKELDPKHWQGGAITGLQLDWLREGVWRQFEPDPASMTTMANAVPIQTYTSTNFSRQAQYLLNKTNGTDLITDPDITTTDEWNVNAYITFTHNQTYLSEACGKFLYTDVPATTGQLYTDWLTLPGSVDFVEVELYIAYDTFGYIPLLIEFNDGGSTTVEMSAGPASSGAWVRVTGFSEIPSGATAVRLYGEEAGSSPYNNKNFYLRDVSITPVTVAAVGGDAGAQMVIKYLTDSVTGLLQSEWYTAVRSYDTLADALAINPWLNAGEETDNTGLLTADAEGPDGQILTIPSGSGSLAYYLKWTLPGAARLWTGRWRAYLIARKQAVADADVYLSVSGLSLPVVRYDLSYISFVDWAVTYFGLFTVPPETILSANSLTLTAVVSRAADTTGIEVGGVVLVPQERIHSAGTLGNDKQLVIDGINGRTFRADASGVFQEEKIGGGRYSIQGEPGRFSVLYAFPISPGDAVIPFEYDRDDIDLTVQYMERYQAIR